MNEVMTDRVLGHMLQQQSLKVHLEWGDTGVFNNSDQRVLIIMKISISLPNFGGGKCYCCNYKAINVKNIIN